MVWYPLKEQYGGFNNIETNSERQLKKAGDLGLLKIKTSQECFGNYKE